MRVYNRLWRHILEETRRKPAIRFYCHGRAESETFIGTLGEKVASGLFEVVLVNEAGQLVSGVFPLT